MHILELVQEKDLLIILTVTEWLHLLTKKTGVVTQVAIDKMKNTYVTHP